MRYETTSSRPCLLDARITVPQHVVFRAFPSETVVLNLQTGKYHGLNPTAGRMLEVVARTGLVRDAAATVAEEFDRPQDEIERDVCDLCHALHERGLVEIVNGDAR